MKKIFIMLAFLFGFIPSANASLIDGIEVGPAGENVFQIGSLWQGIVNAPGQQLQGIGFIDSIKLESTSQLLWQSGDNSRQLGFTYNYTLSSINIITPTISQFNFTGGSIKFYSMPNGTFESNGTYADDVGKIQAGNLWLDLAGADFTGTVIGTSTVFTGLGSGFLDVVGSALANTIFDTNSKPDGAAVLHDMLFNSSFTTSAPGTFYPIVGSVDIYGATNDIPEPTALFLMGIGLLGFGAFTKRKQFKFTVA